MKSMSQIGLGILMVSLAGAGCTKARPYEKVPNAGVEPMAKSIIDESAVYMYVPSEVESPRTVNATRPHWMGSEKLVRFKFTEKNLNLVEIETDDRFNKNPTNNKPVLSIPITHLEFRCKKNANDECSNQEEENNEIAWNLRSKFKMDLNALQVQEVNVLPISIANLFAPCYHEISSQVVDHELTRDVFNLSVERTYESNVQCLSSIDSLSDITFKATSFFSIVKLNSLASSDYESVHYPEKDQGEFGFFTTEKHRLTEDNRDEIDSETVLLNRWNPKKDEIVYFLSDEFNNEGNEAIKKATYEAVAAINSGLAGAKVKTRIRLEEPAGKRAGDLRNNMIVLVEDPQATGVIGYGPTVANPLTGEIINGRVVMYAGTMKKFVRDTYDELVREKQAGPMSTLSDIDSLLTGFSQGRRSDLSVASLSDGLTHSESKKMSSVLGKSSLAKELEKEIVQAKAVSDAQKKKQIGGPVVLTKMQLKQISEEIRNPLLHSTQETGVLNRLAALSKYCAFTGDMFNFEYSVSAAMDSEISAGDLNLNDLKPWAELSDGEKRKVIGKVLPAVWVPTLVHELGHNLGLRHNFSGSEDNANFYTADESAEMGLKRQAKYSSVMDYSYKTLNELRVMGKYDVAALRFGYRHEVEQAEGAGIVNIDEKVAELRKANPKLTLVDSKGPSLSELKRRDATLSLKDFGYCTDEHVDANPGCNRFDEGTTLSEMAAHFVRAYEADYKKVNLRNNRRNFSVMDTGAYASRVDYTMFNLRLFFEVYERISNQYNLTPEQWNSIPFLKDLKDAVDISANFLLNTVITPDVHCALALDNAPSKIVGMNMLATINPASTSCFSAEVKDVLDSVNEERKAKKLPLLLIVAQAGKSFASIKDPSNENPYADQIDVRGVWVDKMLALKYLLKRELGSSLFDKFTDNFLEKDDFANTLLQTFSGITMDSLTSRVPLKNADGEVLTDAKGAAIVIPLEHSLFETHGMAAMAEADPLRKALNLPVTDSTFGRELLRTIATEVPHIFHSTLADPFVNAFSVYARNEVTPISSKLRQLRVGNALYLANEDQLVAQNMFDMVEGGRILSKLTDQTVMSILKVLASGKEPLVAPLPQKGEDVVVIDAAMKLSPEVIEMYLSGEMKSESYYAIMLSGLKNVE